MRLLILKCSARKRGPTEPIPAIERYDGPLWQVVRSYLRGEPSWADNLEVYALSAEYGLFPATEPILYYERTMDAERADALQPEVVRRFGALVGVGYEQLCLGVSKRYLRAMAGWEPLVPSHIAVTVTDGTVGIKLGQLRAWLRGESWQPSQQGPKRLAAPSQPRGSVELCGKVIALAPTAVFAAARNALMQGIGGADRFRDWYVLVDGRPVSAKWLVSQISGLPTSAFDASAARRVLLALGVDVERATQKSKA